MKHWLTGISILLLLTIACIYILIPSRIIFSKVIIIHTKINIANRFLMDSNKWSKWFPQDLLQDSSGKNTYGYNGYFYSIEKKMMNSEELFISNKNLRLKSLITMISLNNNSVAIEWKSELPAGPGPLGRISSYLKAKKLQDNAADILNHLKIFLQKKENIYGIYLHVVISRDSTLVATKCTTNSYPGTADIYTLVARLKTYIASQKARENNFPMLHVKQLNDTTFETMVAIPVNKYLTGNDKIFFKRFVPWKVLTAEVKGGTYTIKEALNQMEIYIADYQDEAMAIPFESLVTNRSEQPDTSKWITGIYTPIR